MSTAKKERTNSKESNEQETKRPEFLDDSIKRKGVMVKDMRDLVNYLKKEAAQMLQVYKDFVLKNGVSSEVFKETKQRFFSDLTQLHNLFPLAMKNERRQKMSAHGGNAGKGFLTPRCFKDDLISFIQNSKKDFGNYCYLDENGNVVESNTLLINKLEFLRIGITATSLLTILFHIYIKRNREVMTVPGKGQYIKFTQNMKEYFGKYKEDLNKKMKQGSIDFDNFPLIRLQTLFSLLIETNPDDERQKALSDPATRQAIVKEQAFLSQTNNALKKMIQPKKGKKQKNEKKQENSVEERPEASEKEEDIKKQKVKGKVEAEDEKKRPSAKEEAPPRRKKMI